MNDDIILVVEANPLIAEAIEKAGDELRVRTDRATDGWEAIGKLENGEARSYRAIVIDSDLPLHSGYGVLAYLREEVGDALENVVVIATDREQVRRHVSDSVRIVDREVASIVRAVADAFTPRSE